MLRKTSAAPQMMKIDETCLVSSALNVFLIKMSVAIPYEEANLDLY